jgi:hypothetical protein
MKEKILGMIFTTLLALMAPSLCAQRLSAATKKVDLPTGYSGTEKYTYYLKNGKEVRHGSYSFQSELVSQLEEGLVRNFEIKGVYRHGKKEQAWEYQEANLFVNIISLQNLKLQTSLDGLERRNVLRYKQGVPHGKWEIVRNSVIDSKRVGQSDVNAFMNFNNGIPSGQFSFDGRMEVGYLKSTGFFDDEGFMHGEWQLTFRTDSTNIRETRLYEHGLLTSIKATHRDSTVQLTFGDVVSQLEYLTENGQATIGLSPEGFGITFNNGYRTKDQRLTVQHKGNVFLKEALEKFTRFIGKSDEMGAVPPEYPLTRRFVYPYADEEKAMVAVLAEEIAETRKYYSEYVEMPKFLINQQKSDSLAYFHAFLQKSIEKFDTLLVNLELFQEDFFVTQDRMQYYAAGVPGLQQPDTLRYTFINQKFIAAYLQGLTITNPERLLGQFQEYFQKIHLTGEELLQQANQELQF